MSETPLELKFTLFDDNSRKMLESYLSKSEISIVFIPIKSHVEIVDDKPVTVYDEIEIKYFNLSPVEIKI